MTAPIDRAFVQIIPDMSRFNAEAKAGINSSLGAMAGSARGAATQVEKDVGSVFTRIGVQAKNAFKEVGKNLNTTLSGLTGMSGKANLGAGIALVSIAAIKMAGDFEEAKTRLVTSAGESKGAIDSVGKGMLSVARDTGTSVHQVADGMYQIESAGYHGAKAVDVMRAAAEGAKIDMADTGVVADALTTALKDLGSKAGPPAVVMSQLVATVGHGKMTMDQLAGSLHSVLPNAAALGLNMAQVGGAIATMTSQGIGAQQATQNLNHTILSLANPTAAMTKAMAAFGLSSVDVQKNIGKRGIDGTLQLLSQTIMSHMGPAGLSLTNSLNTSKIAGGKATEMFGKLTGNARKLASEYMGGNLSMASYTRGAKGLTGQQGILATQWLTTYKRAHGFSDLLKSGSPTALTYSAALAKMTGGQTGLQVALHLTGENMTTLKENIKTIGAATTEAGGHVEGWGEKQKTFNQKMAELKQVILTSVIIIGERLLPVVTAIADILLSRVIPAIGKVIGVIGTVIGKFREFAHWVEAGSKPALAVAAAIGLILLPSIISLGVQMTITVAKTVAGWAVMAAKAMWGAARQAAAWVISNAAAIGGAIVLGINFALIIAGWVAAAVAAMANAVVMAAAWFIALGPIAWVALAVAGLVALIILKWDTVKRWTVEIFTFVLNFIKQNWLTILLVIAGPIGIVIALILHFKSTILGIFSTAASWLIGAGRGIMGGLMGGLSAAWHAVSTFFGNIPGWIGGFFSGAGSWLSGAGSALMNGFGSAVDAAWHGYINFYLFLGQTVASLVGDLGSALLHAGEQLIQGLINGIGNLAGRAADAVVGTLKSAYHSGLHYLGIGSPSKLYAGLGVNTMLGYALGITAGSANVYKSVKVAGEKTVATLNTAIRNGTVGSAGTEGAIQTLINKLRAAAEGIIHTSTTKKSGTTATVTPGLRTGGIVALIALENKQLTSLVNQRKTVAGGLAAATKALGDARNQWWGTRNNVASTIQGSFDITQESGPIGSTLADLAQKVKDAKQFGANINKLTQMGYNKAEVAKLANAGPDASYAAVDSLLHGSASDVKSFNSLTAQLNTAASSVGSQVANSLYLAGINGAKGLVAGLTSQEASLTKTMNRVAASMAATIRKALGIHSPSTVLHGVGQAAMQGLVNGITSMHGDIGAAAKGVSGIVATAGATAPTSRVRGGPGGGIDADSLARAFAGMSIRFDGDGLARLVSAKQAATAVKGSRR